MTLAQIETKYQEVVGRIREILEEVQDKEKEVEREVQKLRMDRDMERRIFGKMKGMKESS